jgi:hypothetical protein
MVHLRRVARVQFSICPPRIEPQNPVSSTLIAHYSSLRHLPYPASPALWEILRQAVRRAVRRAAPRSVW